MSALGLGGQTSGSVLGDVFAGFTTALVMLPLALAYGVATGLGPQAGLYGALAAGLIGFLIGGTRTMIFGPSAPLSLVTAVVVANYANNLTEVFTIVMLAGAMQVVLALTRVGRFVSYTPYSVIAGMMTGIGISIVVLQVPPLLGWPMDLGNTIVGTVLEWPELFRSVNPKALAVGAVTIGVTVWWPKQARPYVPSLMAALIVGCALHQLWIGDMPSIADVPPAWPTLHAPSMSLDVLVRAAQPAATIAFIGTVGTLLFSVMIESITRQPHNPDRDLLALGVGQTLCGVFGGLPGEGSVCTIVNIDAGARTKLAGAVCTAMLLIGAVFSIGQWASLVPHAVLAAVLCKAGFDLIDWRFMSRLRHVQREHLVIAMVTLAITLCFDLITAVAFGFVTAALAGARQLERLELDRVVSTPLLDQAFLGSGDDAFAARVGLVQLRGSFTAASARKLIRIIASDIKHHDVVILEFSQTDYIDDSAALVVEHMIYTAKTENTAVIIVGLRDSVAKSLTGFGILRDVPSQNRVATIDQARELARTMLQDSSTAHDIERDQPLTEIQDAEPARIPNT
ncbi:SulP family inorganic anion transporter [Candidatus Poriferisodalis sp.]|uniref:SulP family inorganic anion transporter n=1 Tax=Candidatus Poriferisodalis sp. TaxID=3101277 RepID=UPI003B01C748